jgi:hypothetical protein
VTDAKGSPVAEASIMLFGEDKGSWRAISVRTRRASPDQTGHFRLIGVLPGRYYIIATPRERLALPSFAMDAGYFEQFAKEATSLVIGEDEQRQVDLKLSAGGG